MVRVSSYKRRSPKGKYHKVKAHIRKTKKRGDYKMIKKKRQLPMKSNGLLDAMIKAKDPGKRKSKSGNTYYERRFNRSDKGEYL